MARPRATPRAAPGRPSRNPSASPPAIERALVVGRGLVADGKFYERLECTVERLAGLQLERVEAAAFQVVQLIAQHPADRAQLAREAVTLAQHARDGIAAAVGESRKLDRDQDDALELGDVRR